MTKEEMRAYIIEAAGQLDGELLRNLHTRSKTLRGMSNGIPDHDTQRNHAERSSAVVTSRRHTVTTE